MNLQNGGMYLCVNGVAVMQADTLCWNTAERTWELRFVFHRSDLPTEIGAVAVMMYSEDNSDILEMPQWVGWLNTHPFADTDTLVIIRPLTFGATHQKVTW